MNGTEIYKFKAKDSEIAASSICLRNISKDWPTDNMKRTGLNGYVYDFSVDYDATGFFHRINNFIRFYKCKFIKLYFNE